MIVFYLSLYFFVFFLSFFLSFSLSLSLSLSPISLSLSLSFSSTLSRCSAIGAERDEDLVEVSGKSSKSSSCMRCRRRGSLARQCGGESKEGLVGESGKS